MKIQEIKENFNVLEPNDTSRLKSIILALQKPKGKRADRECEVVYPLLAKLDFFEKLHGLKKKELMQVCQHLEYRYCEPGETIYNSGDQGDDYYIVIKGRVQLTIPDPANPNMRLRNKTLEEKEEEIRQRELLLKQQQVFVPDRSKLIHVELSAEEFEKLTPAQQAMYRKRAML